MKQFKLLAVTALVGTSFVAGQMLAPSAGVAEPGSADDPAVTKSLMNQELGKLNSEITNLKSTVSSLQKKVDSLSSSNSGSSNSGSSNSGSTSSGTTSSIGTGVVTAESLNVRRGAGTSYTKVGEVRKGANVTILKKSGSWYQIKYNTITGWVSGDYLNVTLNSSNSCTSTTTKTGIVTASSLNIRSGAGTSYKKVGEIKKGTKVTVLKKSGSWYQIKYSTITGWVSAEYLDVN